MSYTPLKGWRTFPESDTPGAVSLSINSDNPDFTVYHIATMLYVDEDWHMALMLQPDLEVAEAICAGITVAIKAFNVMSEADMDNVSQWVAEQRGA